MNELVSIVIPVYNMSESIVECVESIQNQTYSNIEIILVDDGSTDDSYEKCIKIRENDERIFVIHTDNQGSGPARNEGIAVAKGKYIYFPDADDFIDDDTIKICVEEASSNDSIDLIVFGYKIMTRGGRILSQKKYASDLVDGEALRSNYSECLLSDGRFLIQGAPWNKFFKMGVIRTYNIRYPALRRHQDDAFIGRYMSYVKAVKFLPNVLYNYYENDLNNQWKKFPQDYIKSVVGLFEDRKKNILIWSDKDVSTHNIVYVAHFRKIVIAMEQAFSNKYHYNRKERIVFEKDIIKESQVMNIDRLPPLGKFYNLVYKKIQQNKFGMVDFLLAIKVFTEKSGIINIKRYGLFPK